MAHSDLDIINSALLLVADETISDLTENSKAAKICKLKWPMVRDVVLSLHDWNCARTRAALLRDQDVPQFGYDYQYSLPNNPYFLAARGIQFEEGSYYTLTNNRYGGEVDPDYEFAIEGRKLLTDAESVNLVYTARVTDPTVYSAYLLDVFTAKLASEIAYNITGSTSLMQAMQSQYESNFKTARAKNAQEGMPAIPQSSILSVRR